MKNKVSLFLAASLLTAVFIPTIANAGNIKKSYINLAKDGNQATQADLGNIATTYSQIPNALKTVAYNLGYEGINGKILGTTSNAEGLDFNGTNADYVKILDKDKLDILGPITLEAWVKPAGTSMVLISRGGGGGSNLQYLLDLESSNTPRIYIGNGSTNYAAQGKSFTVGEWIHISGVFDGSTLTFYVDGEKGTTTSFSGNQVHFTACPTTLGIYSAAICGVVSQSTYPFKGTVKELRIWNRALTQDEIKKYVKKPITGNPKGLVGYWKFD